MAKNRTKRDYDEGAPARARRTDPVTSRLAGQEDRLVLRQQVLDYVRKAGKRGVSLYEAIRDLADNDYYRGSSITPRFAELVRRGLLTRTEATVRSPYTGRPVGVYVATRD
jgi:hypothetical protein